MSLSKKITGNIHSIETFGTFDGPGVRYVLFLQGCPFKCKFCHNRDTWSTDKNKLMTPNDVYNDFKRFKRFYKNGGITVSGGEPLLQLEFLKELFKLFKEHKIHTCLDTSGACYNEKNNPLFQELLKYTDLVLLDIKQIDEEKHIDLVGSSNKMVLDFAKYLDSLNVNIGTRHILIPTINDSVQDLTRLRAFLDTLNNIVSIDVLPYMTLGIHKWEEMNLTYPLKDIKEPTKKEILNAEKILKKDYLYKK